MDLPKVQLMCPKPGPRGEAKLAKLGRLGDLPQKCTPNPTQIITLYIHVYTRRFDVGYTIIQVGQSERRVGGHLPPAVTVCWQRGSSFIVGSLLDNDN